MNYDRPFDRTEFPSSAQGKLNNNEISDTVSVNKLIVTNNIHISVSALLFTNLSMAAAKRGRVQKKLNSATAPSIHSFILRREQSPKSIVGSLLSYIVS